MLIILIRLRLERQGPSIQFDADDLGAQTQGGRELDPTFAGSAALGFERLGVGGLLIVNIQTIVDI